jgi:hypothetical protein
MLALHHTSVVL